MRYNPPLSTLMSTGSPMATAPILGLSHLTFIVRDVDRTARLFCEGLGAQEVYDSQGRNFSLSREKFVVLGGLWLAFMEGEPPAQRSYGVNNATAEDSADSTPGTQP